MPKKNGATANPSGAASPERGPHTTDRSQLLEAALNTVVLIGLTLAVDIRSRKKYDEELVSDLESSLQWMKDSIAAINEREDLEAQQ